MAAALNSCATLISLDIVKRVRPQTTDKKVVRIGRISTAVIMVLAMLWSTQGDQFGTIFEAINKIPMTFAPAVTTVFVLGVLWKRGTAQGAMTTLYLGSIIGIAYFLIDLPGTGKLFFNASQLQNFAGFISDPVLGLGIPFMLMGPILTVVCVFIYVVRSLTTPAMDKEQVAKVCWDHPLSFLRGKITGISDPRIVTVVLVAVVAILYSIIQTNA
jgi:SSS family solute:Na+ symporter